MPLINRVLEVPHYGWMDDSGELVKPTRKQIWKEAFSRINIFRTKKNWIAPLAWLWALLLLPIFVYFLAFYLSWPLAIGAIVYGAVGMSTHGTVWYHRYCTHRAFKFRNKFWRFIVQNLVIKVIPEELYVISHHVHHAKSDLPGDPYNAQAGFLYCFLADVNHQPIAKDLSEADYKKTAHFLSHTGIYINSYEQYQKWGSVSNPWATLALWLGNWAFWYTVLFFIGGHALALALFSGALFWALGVRTFNYQGHGKGEDKRKEGVDYNWKDLSINQSRPGLLGGEWHNNHHLFPNSARAGFLPYQLDNAWIVIFGLYKMGIVSSYRDAKKEFLEQHYRPNKKAVNKRKDKAMEKAG